MKGSIRQRGADSWELTVDLGHQAYQHAERDIHASVALQVGQNMVGGEQEARIF